MKIPFIFLTLLGLLTCQQRSDGKDAKSPQGCFANDVPEGVELVCDGVPHLIKNGKDGAIGPSGRNGGPGPAGPKGDPGPAGRSISKSQICSLSWDGSPAYKIDFTIFTYSDGVKEAIAIVQADNGDLETNSSLWLQSDDRFATAPTDVGGFFFTQTESSAVVLFRTTGRTDTMTCH